MNLLIPGIVILALLVIIFVRIKSEQKLLDKVKSYEAFLRDARVTRWQYFQCLEKSKEILKDYDRMSDNLTMLKAELLGLRSDFRDELRFLWAEIKKSTGTELDKRTVAQMKVEFEGKWKLFSSRKTNYNGHLDKLLDTKKKMKQASQQEIEASCKWAEEKERVMSLWRELNSRVKITDPHKYFS